jgi:hypothetical protein
MQALVRERGFFFFFFFLEWPFPCQSDFFKLARENTSRAVAISFFL